MVKAKGLFFYFGFFLTLPVSQLAAKKIPTSFGQKIRAVQKQKALQTYQQLLIKGAPKTQIEQALKVYLQLKDETEFSIAKDPNEEGTSPDKSSENFPPASIQEAETLFQKLSDQFQPELFSEENLKILLKLNQLELILGNSGVFQNILKGTVSDKRVKEFKNRSYLDQAHRLITLSNRKWTRDSLSYFRQKANRHYQQFSQINPLKFISKIQSFIGWSRSVGEYHFAFKKGEKTLFSHFSANSPPDSAPFPLQEGHRAKFLFNGIESFPRRYFLMENAKKSIFLQTLYFQNDQSGNKTVDLLIEKANQGLDVRVVVDHYNNRAVFKMDILNRLGASKVKLTLINQLGEKWNNINHRFHQKLLVVDGLTYLVGGMNIGDEYALGGIEESGWRDSDIEITGPTALEASDLFLSNEVCGEREDDWARGKKPRPPIGKGKAGTLNLGSTDHPDLIFGPTPRVFDAPPEVNNVSLNFIPHFPQKTQGDPIEDYYINLVKNSKSEIFLETPYFFPSKKLLSEIIKACHLGKRVVILSNSLYSNDMGKWVVLAARVDLKKIIRAGGEVYEWMGKQTLHSKMGCSDGMNGSHATIGSYNLNNRSHQLDTELNVTSNNQDFYLLIKEAILRDSARCRRVTPKDTENWDDSLKKKWTLKTLKMIDYFY